MINVLKAYLDADVPVVLWGPPGVGKTATVYSLGKKMGLHVETVIASIHEPVDFSGWPYVHDGKLAMAPPYWLKRLKEKGGGILFFDEITNCPLSIQSALLRVVLERVVGDEELPYNVRIIMAANPTSMATDPHGMRLALSNRTAHIEYKLDAGEWSTHFPTYWGDPPKVGKLDEDTWLRARTLVATFIRRRPDLLLQVPKNQTEDNNAWPSPRSWDAASRLIALLLNDGPESWADHAASCIGEGAALEFINWAATMDLPDPEDILRNPTGFQVPDTADKRFALVSSVAACVNNNLTRERWLAFAQVLRRISEAGSDDIAALGMTSLVRQYRQLSWDPKLAIPDDLLDMVRALHTRTGLLPPIGG